MNYVLKPDLICEGENKQDVESCTMIISVLNAQTFLIATNMSNYYLVEVEDSVESEESEEESKKESVKSKDYAMPADYMRPEWFDNSVKWGETLIFFYHPDICHCQHLFNVWEKLRRDKYANNEFIGMSTVNCKEWAELCHYETVKQFPEIWRYRSKSYMKTARYSELPIFADLVLKCRLKKFLGSGLRLVNVNSECVLIQDFSPGSGTNSVQNELWNEFNYGLIILI